VTGPDAVRTLRFAAGTTLSAAFAFGLAYDLAVLTPVMTSVFLGTPAPRPGLRTMVAVLAAAVAGLALGLFATLILPGPFFRILGSVSPIVLPTRSGTSAPEATHMATSSPATASGEYGNGQRGNQKSYRQSNH